MSGGSGGGDPPGTISRFTRIRAAEIKEGHYCRETISICDECVSCTLRVVVTSSAV